jgi:predicted RNase H-like nuclease (RuvC/YqgF family)
MGKTETIKDRRIDVYVNTIERKQKWADKADEAGESLSGFVQQCVEYAIEQGGPDYAELGEESKRIQELESEIAELQDDIKQKEIVIDKLESELQELRSKPFQDEEFEGRREYDQDLIDELQRADRITGDELLRRLDIDPSDTDLVKAVNEQLERLEEFGLVESTPQGWVWAL